MYSFGRWFLCMCWMAAAVSFCGCGGAARRTAVERDAYAYSPVLDEAKRPADTAAASSDVPHVDSAPAEGSSPAAGGGAPGIGDVPVAEPAAAPATAERGKEAPPEDESSDDFFADVPPELRRRLEAFDSSPAAAEAEPRPSVPPSPSPSALLEPVRNPVNPAAGMQGAAAGGDSASRRAGGAARAGVSPAEGRAERNLSLEGDGGDFSSFGASRPGFRRYVVQKGDTLWGIARSWNVSLDDLLEANSELLDNPMLKVGQDLKIPVRPLRRSPDDYRERFHTVRKGETLSSIARLYGVSLEKLMKLNGLDSADYIVVGQRLRIPPR